MSDSVQLDKDVVRFLNSYDLLSRILKVLEENGLEESAYKKIAPVIDKIVDAPQNLALLPKELTKVTGLNETKATRMAADLAGYWLLPLEAYLGDVSGLIVKWGGDISRYSKDKIAKKSIDPMKFTRETLGALGIKMTDSAMQNRLEYILSTLVRGVRVADDAKAVLARGKKVGGLEMEATEASKVVDHFVEKIKTVEIDRGPAVPLEGLEVKKSNPQAPVAKPVAKSAVAPKPQPKPVAKPATIKPMAPVSPEPPVSVSKKPDTVPLEKGDTTRFGDDTFSAEDELEVMETAKRMGKAPTSPVSIKKTVDQVIKEAGIKFKTEEGEKRFRGIVETRLRDIRDALETRDILEDKIEQGGLGLNGSRLVDVVEIIEKAYDVYSDKLKEQKDKEKKDYLQKRQDVETGKDKIARAEADVLAKRYASLTGKAPTHLVTPTAPTAARVSAARGTEADLKASVDQIDEEKVKRVMGTQNKPAQAEKHMSVGSVTRVNGQRPRVQDVAKARKLAGPIDELRQMDTTSFRRLSSDSVEACLKIADKIELLEGESYAKRLEGIKAWQQSPLNKLYLSVVRESLVKGVPVKNIVSEIGSKELALSAEEVQSIMKLNKQLKF